MSLRTITAIVCLCDIVVAGATCYSIGYHNGSTIDRAPRVDLSALYSNSTNMIALRSAHGDDVLGHMCDQLDPQWSGVTAWVAIDQGPSYGKVCHRNFDWIVLRRDDDNRAQKFTDEDEARKWCAWNTCYIAARKIGDFEEHQEAASLQARFTP